MADEVAAPPTPLLLLLLLLLLHLLLVLHLLVVPHLLVVESRNDGECFDSAAAPAARPANDEVEGAEKEKA